MAGVGERLKRARESRGKTIDAMAASSGIGQSYLEALERNDYRALPGPAFGKLYIRAYAEVLDFDPQPWIDDYAREQRLLEGAATEPELLVPSGPRPVAAAIARWKEERTPADKAKPSDPEQGIRSRQPEIPSETRPRATRLVTPLLLLGAVAVASMVYIGSRGTGGPPSRDAEPQPPVIAAPQPTPPVPTPTPAPAPTKTPAVRATSAQGRLTVVTFGVGRRVINQRLEDEGDRFAPGDRVCFSTRVLGGRRGDTIRHVWLYEGRVEQSIALPLGGPDWRTHSNKTVGRAGRWAVEARDEKGGVVLARATFTCAPAAEQPRF